MEENKRHGKTFFVTGLPRSRTAWLANFLTCGESFCFHEAIRDADSLDDLKKMLSNSKYRYTGSSDSSLPLFADKVLKIFPDSRLVVIERDSNEVLNSLSKAFPEFTSQKIDPQKTMELMVNALKQFKSKYNPLVIQYEELNDVNVCRKLWNYLLPDIEFDYERWKLLNLLKVDIQKTKYMKQIKDRWDISLMASIKSEDTTLNFKKEGSENVHRTLN